MSIARVGRGARRRAALILTLPILFLAAAFPAGAPASESARATVSEKVSKSQDRRRCVRASKRSAKRARRRCRGRKAHTALNRRPKRKRPAAAPQASASGGSPTWVGDFEGGSLSQWDGRDGNRSLLERYFRTVSSPTAPGSRFAFAATVDPQASSGDAGHRALLYLYPEDVASKNKSGAYEGSDRWYRTLVYFPADFRPARNTNWNWIVEWHNWPNGPCCANLAVTVDTEDGGERLSLRAMGGGDRAHPIDEYDNADDNPAAHVDTYVGDTALDRGRWYELVTHVKWSADPAKGLLEWWVDGRQVVSTRTSTLFWYADNNENISGQTPGPGQAYYMEGYYRPTKLPGGATDTSSATVYHDGAKIGPTRDSVGG